MPFINLEDLQPINPVPGCGRRLGGHLMLSYLEMDAGAEIPLHRHPQDQGGVLLSGRMELTIGDESRVVEPGALYLIPPNVPHRFEPAEEQSIAQGRPQKQALKRRMERSLPAESPDGDVS